MEQRSTPAGIAALLLLAPLGSAQHEVGGEEVYSPQVADSSEEGAQALARFTAPEGFRIELFAAEPFLANPVAFAIDGLGRYYVAETFRHHAGVTDIRSHMDWKHEDLASRTVEDRLEMIRRHEGENFERYAQEHERVRRIVDVDGDGVADEATVFADGFDHPAAGIGSGLLARGQDVWFTCIPDLVRLSDRDDDGVAEEREVLHTGYGVNVSLLGHDLHGLIRGHDGRLYFSIGDRGLHVETEDGTIAHPHTGAVLRCELDGSGLELYATGLRNPQELAFDDRGDLFTGDNNSDGGDRARIVWVLPGSDSGWRYSYQYINRPNLRGPWNAEQLWRPHFEEQAAYILPPIENFASGPSGFTAYPGGVWGDEWDGTFFLCDFRGNPTLSGVHAFRLEAKGAGFALGESEEFLWGSLVTDVDFDWSGGLAVSDWVSGWNKTGKGRIYRVVPEEAGEAERALVESSALLVAEGFTGRENTELASLLEHPDRRIRLEAQWELASRGQAAGQLLAEVAQDPEAEEAPRLHGVWGLGMVAAAAGVAESGDGAWPLPTLHSLVTDPEAELRAQAIRTLGELGDRSAEGLFLASLKDSSPRVRLFAAEALGRIESSRAVRQLVGLLDREAAEDPWLRTGAIVALDRIGDLEELLSHSSHEDREVRRGICVVLRRHRDPRVASFLVDPDPLVVAEAARAIYDDELREAWPALASLVTADPRGDLSHYTWRRALHAARTVGGEARARQLALCALSSSVPAKAREEMLGVLASWDEELPLDPITGAWRPQRGQGGGAALKARLAAAIAREALADPEGGVAHGWVRLAAASGDGTGLSVTLAELARDGDRSSGLRTDALKAVADHDSLGSPTVEALLADEDGRVRRAAFSEVGRLEKEQALELLGSALESGSEPAGQGALEALAQLESPEADAMLQRQLGLLERGELAPALALDLVQAAARRPGLQERASAWDERSAWEPLMLAGGDPDAGRRVFREKSEASCLRCHRVGDLGGDAHGGEAGPELTDVGARLSPRELVRSILDPNETIAEGFGVWVLGRDGDTPVAGRIIYEDEEWVTLIDRNGEELDVEKSTITSRQKDLSGMPQNASESLSREELRNLVAFLAAQKGK